MKIININMLGFIIDWMNEKDKTETVHRPKKSSVRRKTQPKKVKKDK